MGIYSGLITLGIALWFHQTAIGVNANIAVQEEKHNAWKWFGIGAVSYFGGYLLGYLINWVFWAGALPVGIGDGFGQASGGDSGALGIFLELWPFALGIGIAYVVRRVGLLKANIEVPEFLSKKSE